MQRLSIEVCIGELPITLFPDLKWEDEPIEVKLVRKEETNIWIARDKDGTLHLFSECPVRYFNVWMQRLSIEVCIGELPTALFPDLKWEDEPIEVKLVRKEEKQ